MSKFITKLDIRLKPENDNIWILKSPLIYESDLIGRVEIPIDFETDLASVPRIPFVYSLWGSKAHREAVIHDAMYRLDFPGNITYSQSNNVFLEAMKSTGKPWYISYPMYSAVCAAGWTAFHKKKMDDKLS